MTKIFIGNDWCRHVYGTVESGIGIGFKRYLKYDSEILDSAEDWDIKFNFCPECGERLL